MVFKPTSNFNTNCIYAYLKCGHGFQWQPSHILLSTFWFLFLMDFAIGSLFLYLYDSWFLQYLLSITIANVVVLL